MSSQASQPSRPGGDLEALRGNHGPLPGARYINFVDTLPKTPTGKINKVGLLEATADVANWDREA